MRLLMLPHYSEPLRVLKRYADTARMRGHHVTIVNVCRLGPDRPRAMALLRSWGEPAHAVHAAELEHSPLDEAALAPAWDLLHPRHRLAALRAIARPRLRHAARTLLDTHRPDAVLLANEHMPFLAEVIEACRERGVPTVCLQWTIANSSVRHTLEMYNRFPGRVPRMSETAAAPAPLVRTPRGGLGGAMARAAERRLRPLMRTHDRPIALPSPHYGGGNASVLAVIGDGSRDVYIELGVDPAKIRVVGYPMYEDMVFAAERSFGTLHTPNVELRDRLGLPHVGPLVLWCTNDQPTYWQHRHDQQTMRAAWRAVRDAVLDRLPSAHLAIKPHPKEDPRGYDDLARGERRVSVVVDADIAELIDDAAVVITRFSSTGVTALCRGVPVVTVNFPKVAGGTLFEDMGGTLHCNTEAELHAALGRLARDPGVWDDAADRRRAFIDRYVSIVRGRPAADRLIDEIELLTVGATSVRAATAGAEAAA